MMQQNRAYTQIYGEVGPLPHYPLVPPVTPQREPHLPADSAEFTYPQPVIYLPKDATSNEPTWEYKTVVVAAEEDGISQQKLNAMGNDGWELCNVLTLASSICYYFKRLRV